MNGKVERASDPLVRTADLPVRASLADVYAAMLDQCAWLDALDVDAARVYFSEHHGSEDGGSPSPIVVASAVAARTRRLAITLGAVLARCTTRSGSPRTCRPAEVGRGGGGYPEAGLVREPFELQANAWS